MRTYRFHGLTSDGAEALAAALNEDGLMASVVPPGEQRPTGWGVEAMGDDRSEGLLEMLAHVYGGSYEGEDLAGS